MFTFLCILSLMVVGAKVQDKYNPVAQAHRIDNGVGTKEDYRRMIASANKSLARAEKRAGRPTGN